MGSESSVSDTPFPGARPQVRGAFHQESTSANHCSLALEATAGFSERAWSVRLPVRAEKISIDKQAVVYERVVVRRRAIEEQARVQANVRREELWVSAQEDDNVGGATARSRGPRIAPRPLE
jgi:stress response protein YsnF